MSKFPADWPEGGRINLAVHDLPHRSSTTEWWYQNCHFQTADGRQMSLFAAFFRIAKGQHPVTKDVEYAHSVTWALSDASAKRYYMDCGVDKAAPEMGLEKIRKGKGSKDDRLNRAMQEILEKGHVAKPDRLIEGGIFVNMDRLELDFGGTTFSKNDDGSYHLKVFHEEQAVGASLTFFPDRPPIRHGNDGVVRGVNGEDMFYYFIPRCRVTGTVTMNGVELPLTQGQGWYDHEFGGHSTERKDEGLVAWNWCSLQLDGGTDVSVYALEKSETGENVGRWAIVIDPQGRRYAHEVVAFEPQDSWRSTRTFQDYPTRWKLDIPEAGLSVELEAPFADQEFITVISKPAFWEGRVSVKGTLGGNAVNGVGYVERSGFSDVDGLDDFFGKVGEEVRKSVRALYPDDPTFEQMQNLIATPDRHTYMDGVDLKQLTRTLLKPVREITDRNGKGWRSYAALACCDVVMGDSRKFTEWLAIPELIHVGSLVVDDVQDKSTVRRGGPSSHLVHGEALSINAGTGAYFMCERLLRRSLVSNSDKLKLYDLYFEAMRAGHAGQAIDLDGMDRMMPEVVKTGDGATLENRVRAVHRLKTAAPAGALARMGAVAGGGTTAQVEAVGGFFEAVGLAFQIIDDVLNLRGFRGNLKQLGEDISHGKVTLPIAKAMSRLEAADRSAVWEAITSKSQDPAVVNGVIAKLEACGAVEACATEAREMIDTAWGVLDPVVEDSLAKIMLRAFGWFVLERHY